MFEETDNIDWDALGYPNILIWIHNLTSSDPTLCEKTLDILYDNHITDLSVASKYIVKLIVNVINTNNKCREGILNLLVRIADEASSDRNSSFSKDVLDAIAGGLDKYISLLDEVPTRGTILPLLGYLKENVTEIIPKLLEILDQQDVTAGVIFTINNLFTDNPLISYDHMKDYIRRFLVLLRQTQDDYIRIAMAMLLANLLREKSPPEVSSTIIRALAHITLDFREYSSSTSRLSQALLLLGDNRAITGLIQIITISNDSKAIYRLLPILLNLGFNDGRIINYSTSLKKTGGQFSEINFASLTEAMTKPFNIRTLNATQREILSTIIINDKVWEIQSNIFGLHHLPASRKEIVELLNNSS